MNKNLAEVEKLAVVEITLIDDLDATLGTGTIISRSGVVLTCFHVIGDRKTGTIRNNIVQITHHEIGYSATAKVLEIHASPEEDVVFLQCELPFPDGLAILPISEAGSDREFSSYGYRKASFFKGLHAKGTIRGYTWRRHKKGHSEKLLQLYSNEVDSGMSGAPIIDIKTRTIVGIVSLYWLSETHADSNLAFGIPIESAILLWPDVRKEIGESDINPQNSPIVFFYDRSPYISYLDHLLTEGIEESNGLSVYGFAGVGKSALLRKIPELAQLHDIPVIGKLKGYHVLGSSESLAGFIGRISDISVDVSASKSEYELLDLFALTCTSKGLLVIDNIRSSDTKFKNDVGWLIEALRSNDKCILIVFGSRERFQVSTYIGHHIQLLPLSLLAVRQMIEEHWSGLIQDTDDVFEFTGGNPQLIKYLCSNPQVLANLRKKYMVEFDILHEVRLSLLSEPQLLLASEKLAALSRYTEMIRDTFAESLISNWYNIRDELVNRSILTPIGPDQYEFHDLLSSYLYQRIEQVALLHAEISKSYIQRYDGQEWLALVQHTTDSKDSSLVTQTHQLVEEKIKFFGYAQEIRSCIQQWLQMIGEDQPRTKARLTEDLGFLNYNFVHNYEAALNYFQESRRINIDLGDEKHSAWAEYGIGGILRLQGKHEEALKILREAEGQFRKIDEKRGESWALRELAHVYAALGDITSASSIGMQSKEIAESIGDELGATHSLRFLGSLQLNFGDVMAARGILLQSLEQSQKLHERIGEAYALEGLSMASQFTGDYKQAEEYSRESRKILEIISIRGGAINATLGIARSIRLQGRYKDAFKEYHFALEESLRLGRKDMLIKAGLGLAETIRAAKHYKSAINLYEEYGAKAKKQNFIIETARAMFGEAEISRMEGKPSIEKYNAALNIYEDTGRWPGSISCLAGRRLANISLGKVAEAEADKNQALKLLNAKNITGFNWLFDLQDIAFQVPSLL